ncbi:hypothetical protein CFP56_040656 [Quercus suber]|uniref:Uncharacterized protein n=1 Tax=Quercus suber TaxID=58331 RepID=A0AAW0IXQ1_QUESU
MIPVFLFPPRHCPLLFLPILFLLL